MLKLIELQKRIEKLERKRWGIYRAEVLNVDDPKGLNRIRVQIKGLFGDKTETCWATPKMPAGGDGAGFSWLPKVGDTVCVEFMDGEPGAPMWSGFFWTPLLPVPAESSKDVRVIKSRSGHVIIFGDLEGKEYLRILAQNGSFVLIDDGGIQVYDGKDNLSLVSKKINLGTLNGAAEPLVLGDTWKQLFNEILDWLKNHTHNTGVGPSTVPIQYLQIPGFKNRLPDCLSGQNTTD